MMGFVISVSKDPKYATPPQKPRMAQGTVKAYPESQLDRRSVERR